MFSQLWGSQTIWNHHRILYNHQSTYSKRNPPQCRKKLHSTSLHRQIQYHRHKKKETAVSWSSHCVNKKSPRDYARDRVEKYEKYFKDGEILPIPELVEAVEPKTLSFVVTDIKTKRLAGFKKETFEDLLKTANIPGKYFCRRSFATWDVLLPSEEVAKSLAGGNITTRFFRLQPEYRGKRRIRVTVCNAVEWWRPRRLSKYIRRRGTSHTSNVNTGNRVRWLRIRYVPR